jgi:prepilin-type N-terminal cleavage/methylation domain-containing protein
MRLRELGFTLIEMVVVIILIAVVTSIAVPRAIKLSPMQQVDRAARSLMRDLEQVRMRAIASKRLVRVRFYEAQDFYTAFMDVSPDRSGSISEVPDEVRQSGLIRRGSSSGIPGVVLPKGVKFGAGAAASSPLGGPTAEAIDIENAFVEFDARGLVVPEGAGGVVFLMHEDDPNAVAAVTISGASAFRTWRFSGDTWVK